MSSDFESALCHTLYPLRRALLAVATTLSHGRRKHPDDDGFRAPSSYHIAAAQRHFQLLAAGDETEDHLSHCACRLLLALEARCR
jgi:hypothetical protein